MTSSTKLLKLLVSSWMVITSTGGSGTAGGRRLMAFFNAFVVLTKLSNAKTRILEVIRCWHIGHSWRPPLAHHWCKQSLQKVCPQWMSVSGTLNIPRQIEHVTSSSKDLRALSKGSLEGMIVLGNGTHFRRLAQKKRRLPELNKETDPSCSWMRSVVGRAWISPLIIYNEVIKMLIKA